MFYFVRHGQTDYSQQNTKIYQGFGVNLAGLSREGEAQIRKTAGDSRLAGTTLILSSPYTRAVQTAAILSRALGADIAVETDLHEWLANRDYRYEDDETARRALEEYERDRGRHTSAAQRWEETWALRERVIRVLERYRDWQKVVVVCHGMAIQAVTGKGHPDCGEIVAFDLPR